MSVAENIVSASEFLTDLPAAPIKLAKALVDKATHDIKVAGVEEILKIVKKLRPANGGPVTTAVSVTPAHANQVKRDGVTYDQHDGVFTTGAYTAKPKRGLTRRNTYSRPQARPLSYRPVQRRTYTGVGRYTTPWRVVGRRVAGSRGGPYRRAYGRTGRTYGRSTYGTGRRSRRYSSRRTGRYY